MNLRLQRTDKNDKRTIGLLYIDGVWFCYTLEDPIRATKIWGQTAIPAGRYVIDITYSPRFKKPLPILLDVPNFSGIRIHSGNRPEDTLGCILLGLGRSKNRMLRSRAAIATLQPQVQAALNRKEDVWIEIE